MLENLWYHLEIQDMMKPATNHGMNVMAILTRLMPKRREAMI